MTPTFDTRKRSTKAPSLRKPLVARNAGIAGINVTPIIDVALVLVILLLITAPVMTVSDLEVRLPEAGTRGAEGNRRVNITLAESGELALDRDVIGRDGLQAALVERLAAEDPGEVLVVVRADGHVSHDSVQRIFETARRAGAARMAIATTMSDQETPWNR